MESFLNTICPLFLLFFVFSVLGWCMEVALKYRQYHRFINRGFLIGPYCPIYGGGAVFVTLGVKAFSTVESSYGATFVISFLVCGALEYFVSWYLEKNFHARWWDYSSKPMNLHGRVWIGNLVLFGIGGTFIVKIAVPALYSSFQGIPDRSMYILCGVLAALLIVDNIVSHFVMKFVKTSVEGSEADNTEEISKEIRVLLTDRSVLHRRIAEAYPEVVYKTDRITKKMQEVKEEMERIRSEASTHLETANEKLREDAASHLEAAGEKLQEQKQTLVSMMETTSAIRDDIILKQEQLIDLLQEEAPDSEAAAALKEEIASRRMQLENKKKLLVLQNVSTRK